MALVEFFLWLQKTAASKVMNTCAYIKAKEKWWRKQYDQEEEKSAHSKLHHSDGSHAQCASH